MYKESKQLISGRGIFFWVSVSIVSIVLLCSLAVMIGWLTQNANLIKIIPDIQAMQFNTALNFAIVSTAFLLMKIGSTLWVRILSSIAIFIAISCLIQFFLGFNLGFDPHPMFAKVPHVSAVSMAPNTAICFILIGLSLFINTLKNIRYRFFISLTLASIVLAIAFAALIGYLSGLQTAYGWFQATMMSLQSASLFILMGIGLSLYSWHMFELRHDKWMMFRLSMPFAIFILAATICLWQAMVVQEKRDLINAHSVAGIEIKTLLENVLTFQAEVLERMEKRWELRGETPRKEWEQDAKNIILGQKGIEQIDWIDSFGKTRWRVSREGKEPLIFSIDQSLLKRAKKEDKTVIGLQTLPSGPFIVIVCPLTGKDQLPDGALAMIIDLKLLYNETLLSLKNLHYAISIKDENSVLYSSENERKTASYPAIIPFSVSLLNWKIRVASSEEKSPWFYGLPELALLIGSAMALLVSASVYLGFKSRLKAIQLEKALHELNEAQTRLIQQEKLASLGVVTAGIAHEIKNPLTFINSFSELSLRLIEEFRNGFEHQKKNCPIEDFQELSESLETLNQNVAGINEHGLRATKIIQRMLSLSRGSGQEKKLTNINTLIDDYINLAYRGIRATNPEFLVSMQKEFKSKNILVEVAPEEMGRVLLNLFTNSFYSMQKKQKDLGKSYEPFLHVKTEVRENKIYITIKDNGEGIPAWAQEKIFTPFFTTKPSGEGTGLGLSLSHKIVVQEHKGTIAFSSKEGQFTEFKISLPLKH